MFLAHSAVGFLIILIIVTVSTTDFIVNASDSPVLKMFGRFFIENVMVCICLKTNC